MLQAVVRLPVADNAFDKAHKAGAFGAFGPGFTGRQQHTRNDGFAAQQLALHLLQILAQVFVLH